MNRSRARLTSIAVVVLLAGAGIHLTDPRTSGMSGDWSAKAVDGPVVAGRAVVSGTNTALDLRTGKTVTLGSVHGGEPYVADDRLIIASAGRIDSVRLDATTRWTWQAPAGTTATPLAASSGATLVAVCPTTGTCTYVGLDSRGRQDWSAPSEGRIVSPFGAAAALPRVYAAQVGVGGLLLIDPVSGRQSLRPDGGYTTLPDGTLVTALVQDGQCVVAAYTSADASWTRVLGPCPDKVAPEVSVEDSVLVLTWPSTTQRLDLATGSTVRAPRDQALAGRVVGRTRTLAAVETRKTLHTNPLRWGQQVTVLQVRDRSTGDSRAQLVSGEGLTLLRLESDALVVREGDRVVRYTLDDRT